MLKQIKSEFRTRCLSTWAVDILFFINKRSNSPQDRLNITFLSAAILHILIIFGISFSPLAKELNPTNSLEIVLVQQESVKTPDSAKFLAQANQQASGTTDLENRPSAPFMGTGSLPSTGISPVAMEKSSMERSATTAQQTISSQNSTERARSTLKPPSDDDFTEREVNAQNQRTLEIAQLTAEIAESERRYAKQPRINYIDTLSAKTATEAKYVKTWVDKVERLGNLNYPDEARRNQLSGALILHVLLNRNGGIEQIQISSSSGQQVLDDAAIRITKLAEPFEPFPQEMRETYDQLMITRTWMFRSGNSLITQ